MLRLTCGDMMIDLVTFPRRRFFCGPAQLLPVGTGSSFGMRDCAITLQGFVRKTCLSKPVAFWLATPINNQERHTSSTRCLPLQIASSRRHHLNVARTAWLRIFKRLVIGLLESLDIWASGIRIRKVAVQIPVATI